MKIFTVSHNPETSETLFYEDGVLMVEESRNSLTLVDMLCFDPNDNKPKAKSKKKGIVS